MAVSVGGSDRRLVTGWAAAAKLLLSARSPTAWRRTYAPPPHIRPPRAAQSRPDDRSVPKGDVRDRASRHASAHGGANYEIPP